MPGLQWCSGSPSSSGCMEAFIEQILDGNNRIQTKVDGMGTRVTAVERTTSDISKRAPGCSDLRQRWWTCDAGQDTPLSLAAFSSRPKVARGPKDSASTTTSAAPPAEGQIALTRWKGRSYPSQAFRPTATNSKSRNTSRRPFYRCPAKHFGKRSMENPLAQEIPGADMASLAGLGNDHDKMCGGSSTGLSKTCPSRSSEESTVRPCHQGAGGTAAGCRAEN